MKKKTQFNYVIYLSTENTEFVRSSIYKVCFNKDFVFNKEMKVHVAKQHDRFLSLIRSPHANKNSQEQFTRVFYKVKIEIQNWVAFCILYNAWRVAEPIITLRGRIRKKAFFNSQF